MVARSPDEFALRRNSSPSPRRKYELKVRVYSGPTPEFSAGAEIGWLPAPTAFSAASILVSRSLC